MRLTDAPALAIVSACLWLTLLVSMRGRLVAALTLLSLALVGLVLHAQFNVTTTSFRSVAWLVLLSGALVQARVATTRANRGVAHSVALGSGILAMSVPLGAVIHQPWTVLLLAGTVWLLCSTLPRLVYPSRHRPGRGSLAITELEEALRELRETSSSAVGAVARDTLHALAEATNHTCSIGALAHRLGKPWAQLWIIGAALAEVGEVMFDRTDLSSGARVELLDRAAHRDLPTWQASGELQLVMNFGDQILPGGVKNMSGDHYEISGGNISGAVGRNTIHDITTINQGGPPVAPADLIAELRRVAERLPEADGDELRDAARELDEAKEFGTMRRIAQRVIGIATALGPEGIEMIKLARTVLEQVTSR